MEMDIYSLKDVARILHCQPYRITYLISTGQVPDTRLRVGGKRIFTLADVQRISEKLNMQMGMKLAARGEV